MILFIASGMDMAFHKIKNGLVLVGLGLGILLWIPDISMDSSGNLLAGILLPVVICWIPFLMHALGAGDIKLFSVIGCLNGGRDAVYCICFSFFIAAGFSLGRLLRKKQLWTSLINCFQYFQQIILEKKIVPYPGRYDPDHLIHFSVAILMGYLALLGVKFCKIVPLY